MTVVANGTIVDGTGRPAFRGHVVVERDRIAAVEACGEGAGAEREARRLAGSADTVVDAAGCLVTPGFVDSHAHSDAYLVVEPDAPSKISQGVTTEINGQCGGSAAPRFGEARLSSDWASVLGPRLAWRSMAEYRTTIEDVSPAVNTVQFVGHNTLRSSVMGYAAREATDDELREMRRLLERSLDEGGWGLSTGLIYQPGRYSSPREVLELAKAASLRGGFYATHMRSEGDRLLEAINEVIELAAATGIRAEISHLKTSGHANWHKIDAALEKIDRAVGDGLLLGSDRYPFCAAGTDLDIVLPDWAQEGAAKAECERLADPAMRDRIADEIDASGRDWSTVMIGGTWTQENREYQGRTISGILSRMSMASGTASAASPGRLVCDILARDRCRTGAFFFGMCEENLEKILSRPWITPGSDASLRAPWGPLGKDHPHPRAYATMPEFYRRVRALGFTREESIARMTSVPARRFGLKGRGTLEKGAFADIAVWRESAFRAAATYTDPHRFTAGVECVMVNGATPYRNGRFTGDRAGRFLER